MAIKSKRLAYIAMVAIPALLTLTGCGATESAINANPATVDQAQVEKKTPRDQVSPHKIPLEYMPPPGKCRIWFPGRLPQYQPPPGECADLERHVPLNTWLLRSSTE